LEWLLTTLDAVAVLTVDAMPGGSSSAMHRVALRRADGSGAVVVVRRYVLDRVVTESPEIASDEIAALGLVARSTVPAPEVLAGDSYGDRSDAPTVVMSLLNGRPQWDPRRRHDWIAQVVDTIAQIQTTKIPDAVAVKAIRRYAQNSYDPPRWAQQTATWERAIEIFHGPIPEDDDCLIHRDFHPGNLLWRRDQLTGVVDWQAARIGPASIDPGHYRMNMLFYDANLADELRIAWELRSGHP